MSVSQQPRRAADARPALSTIAAGIASALLAMQALGAHAQDNTLPAVKVTAAPVGGDTLQSIDAARRRLGTVAGGTDVVDAEQYRQGRVSTLSDALQYSPGVFVASRFGAEEARLSIRGSGLQRTFHMRGISLLQDGVPLNLADGGADFQAVEPLAARYIEVYRGANALQYGAATLGGAVNFVSPSGLTAPPLAARMEAGSFGYKRAQVAAAGASDRLDWFIAGAAFFQNGFRAHAEQNTQRLSANLGVQVNSEVETRFFLQGTKSDSELPGALTRAEMLDNPRRADPAAIAGDQHRDFDLLRLSNLTTVALDGERRLQLGGFYSIKSLFHPIFQVLDQDSNDYGASLRYVSEAKLFGQRNRLVLGASIHRGRLDDDRFVNVAGTRGARTAESTQQSSNLSLYAENQHYFLPATALIVGAQAVDARRRLTDLYLANGDQSVDQTYRRISPKLGALHELSPRVQVFGNVSASFEPPSFGELAGGAGVTPVQAQRGATWEIGTRGQADAQIGTVRWDIAAYRANLKNELLSLNDAAGVPLGTRNANATVHQGVEAGVEAGFGRNWVLRASYQLNDFRFDGDPVYRNNRLAGVPRHAVVGELLYKPGDGWYVGPNLRAASAAYVDHANSLQAAGYGVFGFKLGRQVSPKLSWFVDARNLADKTYAATTGVVADARGMDSRQFYPGDGRSLFAGVELKY